MRVLFLPTKTLICCNKRNHNVIFELHSEKRNCENQKKIDRQFMSRTSLTIKHVEKGPKNTGNVPAKLEKSEFFAGLDKIFSKGRVIAKSRLTSSETCYLYGRLTSHLRYVQACLNQCHFETW